MHTTKIAYRVGLLLESGQASAVECAKDAIECAHNAMFGRVFPGFADNEAGQAESAARWTGVRGRLDRARRLARLGLRASGRLVVHPHGARHRVGPHLRTEEHNDETSRTQGR